MNSQLMVGDSITVVLLGDKGGVRGDIVGLPSREYEEDFITIEVTEGPEPGYHYIKNYVRIHKEYEE